MKFFLFVLLCLVACAVTAQTGQPVQAPIIIKRVGSADTIATTFDQAYTIAQNGDAIYLPGGIFKLSSIFNKRLFVYGTGYNPDSSTAMLTTKIQGGYSYSSSSELVFSLGAGSSGFYICGVDFTDIIEINQAVTANFQRCKIVELSLSAEQFILNFNESVIGSTRLPIAPPLYSVWTLNISNSIVESTLFATAWSGNPGANLIIKNSILLGTTNSIINTFRRVEIDKSIIFLKPNAGASATLLQSVTTQSISNNLIISDLASRVNTNSGTDYNNIIKGENFRDSVFINRVGNPYSPIANYQTKSTCTECTNKGVYSDGNGGIGNFRATPPVHISTREISIGSTNNRLRFKFTVKPNN
jgi:hypothetical protein